MLKTREERRRLESLLEQPWMKEKWFADEFKRVTPVLENERTLAGIPAMERNLGIAKSVRESIPSEELAPEHKEAIVASLYYGIPAAKTNFVPSSVRSIVQQANEIRAAVLSNAAEAEVYSKIAGADSRAAFIEMIALSHANLHRIPEEQKRERLAHVAKDIYAPLADILGLRRYKESLEENAFKVFNYPRWLEIHSAVNKHRPALEAAFAAAGEAVEDSLKQLGLVGHVEWRVKEEHSIDRKHFEDIRKGDPRARQGVLGMHDLGAMRVVIRGRPVNSRDASVIMPATDADCYSLSQAITAHSAVANLKLYKDYLRSPKPLFLRVGDKRVQVGEYRSWHGDLTLKHPLARPIELQIRTKEMHDRAERGDAATWMYKGHAVPKKVVDAMNAFARRIKAPPVSGAKQSLLEVTFGGERKFLPSTATIADAVFAQLGAAFGTYPVAAYVDGRKVKGFLQPVKDGSTIRVVRDENGVLPNLGWISHVQPSTAKHLHEILRVKYKKP